MELTLQRIGAWAGTIMILLYGASFSGIAQLFPPLSPVSSADEIATFFTDHKLWVRFGVSGALLSAALALPFLATIGSAGPFIGLFGTVWGIMNSFTAIATQKDTSLADSIH